MRLRCGLNLAFLLAPVLGASTIDVSRETNTVVRTGESLVFRLRTWNFGVNASAFGVPLYPTDVSFAFVSAPLTGAGTFAATLESADRSVSVAFGNPAFTVGKFQGNGYTGEVLTLQGYLHLSPSLSETLFGSSTAIIALRNQGPDVTVGLADYFLRQNLYTSLSGGPLSVGTTPGAVELESPELRDRLGNRGAMSRTLDSEVPEPGSGVMMVSGFGVLCLLSVALSRLYRAREARLRNTKNQPFASANPL